MAAAGLSSDLASRRGHEKQRKPAEHPLPEKNGRADEHGL
jgi:hypothetical protein